MPREHLTHGATLASDIDRHGLRVDDANDHLLHRVRRLRQVRRHPLLDGGRDVVADRVLRPRLGRRDGIRLQVRCNPAPRPPFV